MESNDNSTKKMKNDTKNNEQNSNVIQDGKEKKLFSKNDASKSENKEELNDQNKNKKKVEEEDKSIAKSKPKPKKKDKKQKEKTDEIKDQNKEQNKEEIKAPEETKIINDKKEQKKPVSEIVSKQRLKLNPNIKVSFIFRRNLYNIELNYKATETDLIQKICDELKLDKTEIEVTSNNNKIIKESQNLIKDIFDKNKLICLDVNKLLKNSEFLSNYYPKNYNFSVIVENIELIDLQQIVDGFFKDLRQASDFLITPKKDQPVFTVSFQYAETAFDFNRLLLLLKSTEEKYKDIKSALKNKKTNNTKNNNNNNTEKNTVDNFILNNKNKNKSKIKEYDHGLYVGMSGKYMSQEDLHNLEVKENKKKWLNGDFYV